VPDLGPILELLLTLLKEHIEVLLVLLGGFTPRVERDPDVGFGEELPWQLYHHFNHPLSLAELRLVHLDRFAIIHLGICFSEGTAKETFLRS